MKAVGKFIVVEIVAEEQKVTKAGLLLPSTSESYTTNSGDKVGVKHRNIVKSIGSQVELAVQEGDEVIVNPWNLQLFEVEDKTYGAVPESEVKVVL